MKNLTAQQKLRVQKEFTHFKITHGALPEKLADFKSGSFSRSERPYASWLIKQLKKKSLNNNPNEKVIRDSKGRKIPAKYLTGYKGAKLKKRKNEIEQRRDEYRDALDKYGDEDDFPKKVLKKLYRPFETDKGVKSKKSSYTVTAKKRGFTGGVPNKAEQASEYYGGKISPDILEQVKDRGYAAWASGGHRPGQTSHSWGHARVNSFLTGGKTFWTADQDLAKKLPKKVYKAIAKERSWKGNPLRRNRDTRNVPTISSWEFPNRAGSVVQTIIFDSALFDGNQARAWLRKHDFKTPKMDRTENYMRYRQYHPNYFHKDSFRTLEFKDGVLAVVAIPKK